MPQTSTSVVAARSKAKAKPQTRELVGTTATIPINERRWIDIEPSKQDLDSYDLSKKVINLLRHNQTLQREEEAKAKPQVWEPVDTPTIIPMHERKWIDIAPSEPNLAAYDVSKKVISLLRHNQTVQREKDGATQFWRMKILSSTSTELV